jgi:tripartite-type tricarboxylate transporter receptor subunit TctC
MSQGLLKIACVAAALATMAQAGGAAAADAVADFYAGKQIRVLIGFPPGGGYDTYARLLAKHMPKHIPGKPTMIVQNMPGAGSMIAAQNLMQQAPRDGTVVGTISKDSPMDVVVNSSPYRADFAKLNWIGNVSEDNNIMTVWAATGVKTIEDAKNKELVMGATAANGAAALYPRLLNNTLGTKFKILAGFPGSTELNLAMEKGEIDGRGSDSWVTLRGSRPDWVRDKKVNVLMQMGFRRDEETKDIPLMIDLATTPAEKILFEMLSSGSRVGNPLVTTPDVPADRLEALRAAFDQVVQDPEFLAEAQAAKLTVYAAPGKAVQEAVAKTVNAPPDVVSLVTAAMSGDKPFNCADVAKDKSLCGK